MDWCCFWKLSCLDNNLYCTRNLSLQAVDFPLIPSILFYETTKKFCQDWNVMMALVVPSPPLTAQTPRHSFRFLISTLVFSVFVLLFSLCVCVCVCVCVWDALSIKGYYSMSPYDDGYVSVIPFFIPACDPRSCKLFTPHHPPPHNSPASLLSLHLHLVFHLFLSVPSPSDGSKPLFPCLLYLSHITSCVLIVPGRVA